MANLAKFKPSKAFPKSYSNRIMITSLNNYLPQ